MKNFIKFHDAVTLKPIKVSSKIKDFFSNPSNTRSVLRIRLAATHAGKVTRNNGFYLPHKMKEGAKTFVDPYKKPIQIHHGDNVDPIGRVVQANYVDTSTNLRDYWDAKKLVDSQRPISDALLDAFCQGKLTDKESREFVAKYFIQDVSIIDDPNYEGLGYIELIADITDPEAIQKVLDGRYLTGSVGASTDAAICSISNCGKDWAKEGGRCEHTPGKVYDGQKCVLIAGNFVYDEWSFVNKPADVHSSVIEVNVGGVQDSVQVEKNDKASIPSITLTLTDSMLKDQDIKSITMKTGETDEHKHIAYLDEDGDGETSWDNGHSHKVIGFKVMPSASALHEGEHVQSHSHDLHNPLKSVRKDSANRSREESQMLFKDAFERVSKLNFFKDQKDLATAVKAVLDNKEFEDDQKEKELERLVAKQLGRLKDYDETFSNKDDGKETDIDEDIQTIKDFFGEDYDEIVGDDPWGHEYAAMMYTLLEDATDENHDEIVEKIKDARLTAKQRKKLPSSVFCGPGRSFPVNDCAHYTAALRLLARSKKGNKDSIRACIIRKGKRLGCPGAKNKKDSVDLGEFTLEYFDTFDDEQLIQLATGLRLALNDRKLSCCSECEDSTSLKNRISELETELEEAKKNMKDTARLNALEERLDAARAEARFLHQDIENLQDQLAQKSASIRDAIISHIADFSCLSGETVTVQDKVEELKDKSSDELDGILKDLRAKVDISKIADTLNSGLSNQPKGSVADPTLKVDNHSSNDVEVTRETLLKIQENVMKFRLQPNGQYLANKYIEDCKKSGLIPAELDVQDPS